METGERIRSVREKTGMNRKEFSDCFKIPLRTIEDWEAGKRNPPEYVSRMLAYYIYFLKLNAEKSLNERKISIVTDPDGQRIVLINDKKFKGTDKEDWKKIEEYLARYVGEYYEIAESSEKIYIDKDMPDEYANSKERISLKGANKKAKANAAQGIPELIQVATNPEWEINREEKHKEDARFGWYRYEVRFGLPIYDDKSGELVRYNIFSAKMLVRHDADGKKYMYDLLAIKKRNEQPV